jgi:outer membrane protein OmpA-like peptidoglycan-associated protein
MCIFLSLGNERLLYNEILLTHDYIVILFIFIVLFLYILISASEYLKSISVHTKWKEALSLSDIGYSKCRIEIFSAIFFLLPPFLFMIFMMNISLPYLVYKDNWFILIQCSIIVAYSIFFYGWIIFIRCKRKIEIIKASILLSLFVNLPGCASRPVTHGEINTVHTKTVSIDYNNDIFSHLLNMFFGIVNYNGTIHIELIKLYIIYFVMIIPFVSTCYIVFLLIEKAVAQVVYACRFLGKQILLLRTRISKKYFAIVTILLILCIIYLYNDLSKDSNTHSKTQIQLYNENTIHIITPDTIDSSTAEANMLLTQLNICFARDNNELTEEAIESLNDFILKISDEDYSSIEISGHTDSIGKVEQNLAISNARARIVRDYLIAHKIPANKIHAIGYGASNPKYDNNTDEGRRLNRRVEIEVRF